ncbi:MAG: acetylxylan esterase [Firmicutes bacterium]|nr:acetylxylan esterase [Bacillota bacterium]
MRLTKAEQKRIDKFCDDIFAASQIKCKTTVIRPDPFKPDIYPFQNLGQDRYVKFEPDGGCAFFGYWQPCFRKQAPLLIHTPGYGAEMSMHPELTDSFNVLHVNPLGICTPDGRDATKMTFEGLSSVLPDTIKTGGKRGYFDWLSCVSIAVNWAWNQDNVVANKVSFFGTSQGGGAALLMGSVFSGRGTACVAADQSFLTNFELGKGRGGYDSLIAKQKLFPHLSDEDILDALFCYDTMHHVHRLDNIPVLLTAGGKDDVCPFDTIASLFKALNGTKSYTLFDELPHGYNRQFISLARAWFMLYS